MLAPGHPDAPKYWMHETSGVLALAVKRYLNREALTVRDLAVLKAYLRQWICSPVWDMNPTADLRSHLALGRLRKAVETLHSREHIDAWIHTALEEGHDPL